MILLCGIPSESPVLMVHEALNRLGVSHIIFNQRQFAKSHFNFEIVQGALSGILNLDGHQFDLENIRGIYTRLMDDRFLPEIVNLPLQSKERIHCRNLHDALIRWMEITPIRVLNRFGPMGSNFSKPYQIQLISKLGFEVPKTLITNDPKIVLDFKKKYNRIIYKSISSVRSIVQELQNSDISRLEHIRWCPTQFQEYIEGNNVRVHVVGQEIFSTEINSEATDYRYARQQKYEAKISTIELDDHLGKKCVQLSKALNLPFAGIDLKITPNGRVYCLEVNPSPGFSYYEQSTGQPISTSVARYLSASG